MPEGVTEGSVLQVAMAPGPPAEREREPAAQQQERFRQLMRVHNASAATYIGEVLREVVEESALAGAMVLGFGVLVASTLAGPAGLPEQEELAGPPEPAGPARLRRPERDPDGPRGARARRAAAHCAAPSHGH